jgi:hypothetical protein
MAASSRMLATLLQDKGKTYDEFIWDVINRAEVAA